MRSLQNKYVSNTALLDFIFLLLLTVVTMFIILMAILRTETSPPAIVDRNQFVILMEWSPESTSDLDMWMLDPNNYSVSYQRKEGNGLFLQRDDLGGSNDWVEDTEGNRTRVVLNQEIINVRQFIPGRYHVNAHYYSGEGTVEVELTLIKVTPFKQYEPIVVQMGTTGAEVPLLTMELDESGEVTLFPTVRKQFILQHKEEAKRRQNTARRISQTISPSPHTDSSTPPHLGGY